MTSDPHRTSTRYAIGQSVLLAAFAASFFADKMRTWGIVPGW